MRVQSLRRLLLAYAFALVVCAIVVHSKFSLRGSSTSVVVVSHWRDGKRVHREIRDESHANASSSTEHSEETAVVVEEVIVSEAYMHPISLPLGLVSGHDGVKATLDARTVYATVDDLLRVQAYDHGSLESASVLAVLANELGVTPIELADRGVFRRVRFERHVSSHAKKEDIHVTREEVTAAARDAAHWLARSVEANGDYRYLVDARNNAAIDAKYNWPRHGGSTLFLGEAAEMLDDAEARRASLRAAARIHEEIHACGPHKCVSPANEERPDIGGSALGLLALTQVADDNRSAASVNELAEFLLSQQRPDGELMHRYDRTASAPIDIQLPYFTGEAALALGRAHRMTGNPAHLEAARRALTYMTGSKARHLLANRYVFGEEHWTCQTLAELWDRVRDEDALAFCVDWNAYQRRLQKDSGAFSEELFAAPRIAPSASRAEGVSALLAVLEIEHKAGRLKYEEERLATIEELNRALLFVMQNQFRPGPTHLFVHPEAAFGAIPGSAVDWQLRIDYAQHAGGVMLRWLKLNPSPPPPPL